MARLSVRGDLLTFRTFFFLRKKAFNLWKRLGFCFLEFQMSFSLKSNRYHWNFFRSLMLLFEFHWLQNRFVLFRTIERTWRVKIPRNGIIFSGLGKSRRARSSWLSYEAILANFYYYFFSSANYAGKSTLTCLYRLI